MTGPQSVRDLRVLIIEDESLISMLIEDTLADIGCTVAGIASELDEAMSMVSSMSFDVAILDVNLNGARVYPVAEILSERQIPFVFSTGYGAKGVPEAFRRIPIVAKPFRDQDLKKALSEAVHRDR